MPHVSLKYFKPYVAFFQVTHWSLHLSFRPELSHTHSRVFFRRWFPRVVSTCGLFPHEKSSGEALKTWICERWAASPKVDPPVVGGGLVLPCLKDFKSINRKQGEGWNNDEIQDGLRWTKLMNTVSLGKVFNKSECYVNQNYWNVYIERSQPKNGSPVAGRFDVTHHILSNHQAIWHDFVVVVVQGLTKIIGTTIPERFPILYSPVLWESILGCHPRGQKWKSNVWSWRELYQHKDMMFCMKNYRLLSKVTSIVCESTNLKTKQQIGTKKIK